MKAFPVSSDDKRIERRVDADVNVVPCLRLGDHLAQNRTGIHRFCGRALGAGLKAGKSKQLANEAACAVDGLDDLAQRIVAHRGVLRCKGDLRLCLEAGQRRAQFMGGEGRYILFVPSGRLDLGKLAVDGKEKRTDFRRGRL